MKQIVVPVNFTANSLNAARYAADMAAAIGGELHLVYVVQYPLTMSDIIMPDYIFEEMQQSGKEQLRNLADQLTERTLSIVPIITNMELGSVEVKLEEYCRQVNPFVVVMGASGHSLENAFAGSTTVRAMRRLPYPLLVIPENATYHIVKKIVLACDLEDLGGGVPASISFFKELKSLFGSRFELVNVTTRAEAGIGQATFQFDSWKDRLKEIFPDLRFIHTEHIAEGVKHYLSDNQADWLMVFPKKHSFVDFHTSQSKKLLHDSIVPVMSLHE
ncbi:MAG: universal stress protein [Bacteroidetes bacterium]|nr:universal stress protein [Bacteroidota bacterium]